MKDDLKRKKKKLMKNIRKNQENRMRNKKYKSEIRNIKKNIINQLNDKNQVDKNIIEQKFQLFQKKAYSAVSKGVFHKNTISRYTSRLAKNIKNVLNK